MVTACRDFRRAAFPCGKGLLRTVVDAGPYNINASDITGDCHVAAVGQLLAMTG